MCLHVQIKNIYRFPTYSFLATVLTTASDDMSAFYEEIKIQERQKSDNITYNNSSFSHGAKLRITPIV